MLADRISVSLAERFKIVPPPTLIAKIAGTAEIAYSRFRNDQPMPGSARSLNREESFAFNIPLIHARYSRVAIAGIAQSVVQSPGQAYLFDLNIPNEISLDAVYDSIRIHISKASIDAICYEKGLARIGGLFSRDLGQDDPVLYHLALAILPALEDASRATTAFVEYLSLAFHEHIFHTYGGAPVESRTAGCLAPWQLRLALDYFDANLAGDPSIASASKECGISEGYFARAFRASTGMAPHQWITTMRVRRAQKLISESNFSLTEIAFICGFVDQSHLGRHFVRVVGVTPGKWRRRSAYR